MHTRILMILPLIVALVPLHAQASSGTEEYAVELSNFKFSPTTIDVEAGEKVVFVLKNTGGTHDFVIDELNVQSRTLQTGQEERIEVEIPEDAAGKDYEFYCSIGNHRAMGMKGTLHVSTEEEEEA